MTNIEVKPPFIKLDQFLKFANVIYSGGEAKTVIAEGMVEVNGEVCTMRGKKLYDGYTVSFNGEDFKVVISE